MKTHEQHNFKEETNCQKKTHEKLFNLISNQEMKIKITMDYHFHPKICKGW